MRRYVAARLAQSALVVLLSLTAVFGTVRLGGDPVLLFLPMDIQTKDVNEYRERLGFNDPLLVSWAWTTRRAPPPPAPSGPATSGSRGSGIAPGRATRAATSSAPPPSGTTPATSARPSPSGAWPGSASDVDRRDSRPRPRYTTVPREYTGREVAMGMTQLMDPKGRAEAYADLQRVVHDEAPWVFLWQQHDLYGVASTVEWTPRADEKVWMYDARVVAR